MSADVPGPSGQVYFNQKQFAERIGKSTHWLWQMEAQGLVKPLRVGGSLFYSDDMLAKAKPVEPSHKDDFESQVEEGVARLLRINHEGPSDRGLPSSAPDRAK